MAAKKKSKASATDAATAASPAFADDDIAVEVLGGIRAACGGDDVAMFVGSDAMAFKIRGVISTQCPGLDVALGRGGVPLARLTILHGKEGCGKTTLALHIVAQCQQEGGLAVYIDKEHTLDPEYAAAIGVDVNRLIISQDGTLEDIVKMMYKIIDLAAAHRQRLGRRVPIVIVLDSINAAIAKCRIDGQPGDAHVAPEARIWSAELPKLCAACYKEDVALIFISQVRKKLNVMFGDPDEIAGGEAPKFYASIILKLTPTGASRESADGAATTGDDQDAIKVGYMCEAQAKKNKVAPPFRKAGFLVRYGQGIDFHYSLLMTAVAQKIVVKTGGWFSYNDERIGNGAIAAAKALAANATMTADINWALRSKMGWVEEAEAAAESGEVIHHSDDCLASPGDCIEGCPAYGL